jgi:hypothetical protein
LHLWNEHLGVAGSDYSVFAWGVELLKRLRFSLILLADHLNLNEEWKDVKAVHACFATCLRRPERGFEHLGFSITSPKRSLSTRTHDFFEAFLIHSLIWAFRPCGKRKHPQDSQASGVVVVDSAIARPLWPLCPGSREDGSRNPELPLRGPVRLQPI